MLRRRALLAIATCAAALVLTAASAGAAPNLNGFATTFPKASALCVKADKGKLAKKLSPSKAKVKNACRTLRSAYSDAAGTLDATTAPLRLQMKSIIAAQRAACLQARQNRDRLGCRNAALAARTQLTQIRTQIAAAQATARASYDKARKTFWATIKKLRGSTALTPDGPVADPTVTDIPPDTALDTTP